MWVSSQFGLGTSVDIGLAWWDIVKQEEDFFALLKTDKVKSFLHGVVYSPWSSCHIDKFRESVPALFPIRNYPDICHTASCQNPVDGWDVAFFVINLRETINPRPSTFARVIKDQSKYTIGSGCYSEGVSDDVNKYVWSIGLWGGDAIGPVVWAEHMDILKFGLTQYASLLVGLPLLASLVEEGIMALERNWHSGPILLTNQIERTFQIWKEVEENLAPRHMHNWRLNMCLFRAYYDMFIKKRLLEEDGASNAALKVIMSCGKNLTMSCINKALAAIDKAYESESLATTFPTSISKLNGGPPNVVRVTETATVGFLYARLQTLAGMLYEQIGLQLSIEYGSQHRARGSFFDCAWTPLGDTQYIKRLIEETREKMESNKKAASSYLWTNIEPLLLSGGHATSDLYKGGNMIWHGSFGERVFTGSDIATLPDVIFPHKKFELGDDPNFFQRPLVEQIASDNDNILNGLERGSVPRSYRSWLVTMWPHIEVKFRFPLVTVLEKIPSNDKLFVRLTYVGKDIIDLGGDWQELGRSTEDAKLVCNGIKLHDYMSTPKTTTVLEIEVPTEALSSSSGFLTFELLPRDAIKMRYTNPLLPIAELALLTKVGHPISSKF